MPTINSLKLAMLHISVERTASLLFELNITVLYIKVKFIHNLLKLIPIHHLVQATKSFAYFYIFWKKVRPTELIEWKPLTEMFLWNSKACKSFKPYFLNVLRRPINLNPPDRNLNNFKNFSLWNLKTLLLANFKM